MEKIFVQIASYRDPECQWTVKDLFEKAAHPERVTVGICWQFDENEDKQCFVEPYARPAQVRTLKYHYNESQGSGWAHSQAQSLWDGEEYVLQIHAHMRFEPGWDDMLIEQLARCPSEKPALSTCLSGYLPPNEMPFRDQTRASFVFVNDVKPAEPQLLTLLGALVDKNEEMAGPSHTPFWIGVFLFARARMMQEVPFDPHIQYYGEPLAYSARLFTHGWDLFEPDQLVLYHWWGRPFELPRPYRELGTERQKHTFMRVKHLLRFEASAQSAALNELEQYGLGSMRNISDFWQFCGVDLRNGKCNELAHKGRWNELYAKYLLKAAQPVNLPPRIFVQIASYRDPECQWTVKDLFEKAKNPDRVFVGICWQHDPEEDQDYFRVSTRPAQVRTALFHWKESQGVCWARHQTQSLWEGEEYTLMIDSHMRFEFDWDDRLIEDLAMCRSPKAVLSNYPAAFTPPHNLEVGTKPTIQRPHPYDDGDIRFRGDNLDHFPPRPLRGAFIAAGFFFAKSEVIKEVPYDPYLYFNQEELSLAVRLFTHGWDVYSMRQVLIYHLYITDPATKKRPLHWEDNKKWGEMQLTARKRMDHLMGYTFSDDPLVTRDLDKYGLGTVRGIEEFAAFCGVDFKTRHISEYALRAQYVEDLKKYKDKKIFIPEIDNLEEYEAEQNEAGLPTAGFADPMRAIRQPFDVMLMTNDTKRKLHHVQSAPAGILILHEFLDPQICRSLMDYAKAQSYAQSVKGERAEIDGMAGEVLTLFNDIFCHRLTPFYNADFEWYERPHILRYPEGVGHGQHSDAEAWQPDTKKWARAADRDYTVLLTLNHDYTGGEIDFTEQNYRIAPRAGTLIAFPSSHRYLYSAQPAAGNARHLLVSWGAQLGTPRARPLSPYASVFLRYRRPKQS